MSPRGLARLRSLRELPVVVDGLADVATYCLTCAGMHARCACVRAPSPMPALPMQLLPMRRHELTYVVRLVQALLDVV